MLLLLLHYVDYQGAWLDLFFCTLSRIQSDEKCAVSCDIVSAKMKQVNSRTNRQLLTSDRGDKITACLAVIQAEVLIEDRADRIL